MVIALIGITVILCLVLLNLLFIYFIIDNPYQTTHSTTPPTTRFTFAPMTITEFEYEPDTEPEAEESPGEGEESPAER